MVELRRFCATDGPAWFKVFESVAAEGLWIGAEAPVDLARSTLNVTRRFVDRPDAAMFLGFVDHETVAYIHVEIDQAGAAEFGMAILDGFRGQGIGSLMMTTAIEWAETAGARRLHLDVFPHNDRAIALYRKFGFVETERRPRAWPRRSGDVWDLVAMEREVSTATPPAAS